MNPFSSVPPIQERILELLRDKEPLSTRAISWKLGPNYEIVKEELLRLQKDGLVFLSSWELLDEDWAITKLGTQLFEAT